MAMTDQQVSKRWIITGVSAVACAFVVVLAVLIGTGSNSGTNAGSRTASTSTTSTSTTTTRSTSTTPPLPPQVIFSCYLDVGYTNRQQLTMDVGGDFGPIWAATPKTCEVTREPAALTPIEQQAFSASGYTDETSIKTLYGLCAVVDPNHTYISPTHTLSAGQISEVTGMLTLCPNHPLAAQLRDAVARGQAEAAAEAAGELFHGGTYLVNSQIKPGTYAVEGEITDCYWERTDANGEIIDNNFVTSARRVQVKIRASDYSFHSEGCGKWRKVG